MPGPTSSFRGFTGAAAGGAASGGRHRAAGDHAGAGNRRRRRRRRASRVAKGPRSPRWLLLHAGVYLVVNGFFIAIWLLAPAVPGVQEQFWPKWIMLLLGVPLGLHVVGILATRPSREAAGQRHPPAASAPGHGVHWPAGPERTLATVLFTDIVGSTERAAQLGDRRWGELLDAHDRLAHELVDRFGGRLVKSTGDGILALFDRPGRGIRCATTLRDGLRGIGVEIRAGLHTGEVQVRGGDVGGIAVHIAARVMATAAAGEVLVSQTVHDLVAGSDFVLEDRGAYALKGMGGQWQLYTVRTADGSAAT
jgi:class 3 adenylate cyclase